MYSLNAGKSKFLYSKIHQIMLSGIVRAREKAENVTCHMMKVQVALSKIPVIIGKKLEKDCSWSKKKNNNNTVYKYEDGRI